MKLNDAKQRTITKQVIGRLLWLTVARCDMEHRISALEAPAVGSLGDFKKYREWIRGDNEPIENATSPPFYLRLSSPISYVPGAANELLTRLQFYCF